ncbi:DNA-processing protein DprA [Candidatus Parcubacteria bacterium]|nr:DNA-processing protein DprA [Candidatus Parcubacteria bacterium]
MNSEIKTISIKDKNYPKLLKEIRGAPEILYYRGKLNSDEPCFAIVGTRLCSAYGKQIAWEIAQDLAEAGLTIVSGFASGIDTICHQAVVEKGKRTIAVLGTGLDEKSIYPQSNLKLAQKILETNGCLVSEYPPGTSGALFTFPQRNRIISGLSAGVLVIEAKQKSGALITANWAKQQKRKIFAVPGQIHSLNSKGCHYLIKQGAKLTENAQDILKELELNQGLLKLGLVKPDFTELKGDNKEENLILDALKQEPLNVDKIIEKTKLSASVIAGALAILEIKDKIRNLGENIYAISRG